MVIISMIKAICNARTCLVFLDVRSCLDLFSFAIIDSPERSQIFFLLTELLTQVLASL